MLVSCRLINDTRRPGQRPKTVSLTAKGLGSISMVTKGSSAPVPTEVTRMGLDEQLHMPWVCMTGEEL